MTSGSGWLDAREADVQKRYGCRRKAAAAGNARGKQGDRCAEHDRKAVGGEARRTGRRLICAFVAIPRGCLGTIIACDGMRRLMDGRFTGRVSAAECNCIASSAVMGLHSGEGAMDEWRANQCDSEQSSHDKMRHPHGSDDSARTRWSKNILANGTFAHVKVCRVADPSIRADHRRRAPPAVRRTARHPGPGRRSPALPQAAAASRASSRHGGRRVRRARWRARDPG